MTFIPALDRGNIESLAELRSDFTPSTLADWRGFLVTAQGDLGLLQGLWSVPASLAADLGTPWLMGRTADQVTHCVWVADSALVHVAQDRYGVSFAPITQVGSDLSDDEALMASQAVALARWHTSARFCAACGQSVQVIEAGWASRCTSCRQVEYPRTDPAVIVLITDAEDRVLLAHNTSWGDTNLWSLPAGFVEAGETPRRAVIREVFEEVGVLVDSVQYVGAQPWPGPRSLMMGFRARAVPGGSQVRPDGVEIDRAGFFARNEYEAALLSGEMRMPRPTAIAATMLQEWLGKPLPYPQI